MLGEYINTQVFIVAFFIGMFLAYIYIPPPRIVYKFPNPYSSGDVYQLDNGNCYAYDIQEVACTPDALPLPISSNAP